MKVLATLSKKWWLGEPRRNRVLAAGMLVLLCGLFALFGMIGVSMHTDIMERDTGNYISEALVIQNIGWAQFIPACWRGEYRIDNRHPLYLVLLSFLAKIDPEAFVRMKLMTWGIGFLMVAAFFGMAAHLYDWATATFSTLLLVLNAGFIRYSTMVTCEVLLVLCIMASWYLTIVGFRRPVMWIGAGIASGLAFLTKGTGILVVPVFLVTTVFVYHGNLLRLLRNRYFWSFWIAFVLVSSPLLIRNAKVYGDPFYNFNRKLLWIDHLEEALRPDFPVHSPSPQSFWERHGAGGILRIFVESIVRRGPYMVREELEPYHFWRFNETVQLTYSNRVVKMSVWVTVLMLGCAAVGLMNIPRREERWLSLVWMTTIYIFIAWYSKIGIMPHLMFPLIPFVLLYAGSGLGKITGGILRGKTATPNAAMAIVLMTAIAVPAGWGSKNVDWREVSLSKTVSIPPHCYEIYDWIQQHVRPYDRSFFATTTMGYLFLIGAMKQDAEWLWPSRRGLWQEWPHQENMDAFKQYIQKEHIRFGIIETEMFTQRRLWFREYIDVDPARGIVVSRPIPGFCIVAKDPSPVCSYLIFEFDTEQF